MKVGAIVVAFAITSLGTPLAFPGGVAQADDASTLFVGAISDASGAPVAGASVELRAWPDTAALDLLSEGEHFDLQVLDSVTTGPNGTYALSIGDSRGSKLAGPDLEVDLDIVVVTDAGSLAVYPTTRRAGSSGELLVIDELNSDMVLDDSPGSPDTWRGTGVLDTSIGRATEVSTGEDQVQQEVDFVMPTLPPLEDQQSAPTAGCRNGGVLKQRYDNVTTYVGATYATATGRQQFSYTTGNSARISEGFRAGYQDYGAFTRGKELSRFTSMNTSWAATTSATNSVKATKFNFGRFLLCGGAGNTQWWQSVRPVSHAGGAWSQTAAPITANYCVPLEKNATMVVSSTRAITWSSGVKLGDTNVGINLTSSAGFSSGIKQSFTANSGRRAVCGRYGYPGSGPRQLVLRPWLAL